MTRAAAPSLPCCPRHRLNYALHKAVSRTAWATAHGVALREVDGVLDGRLAPGDAMLGRPGAGTGHRVQGEAVVSGTAEPHPDMHRLVGMLAGDRVTIRNPPGEIEVVDAEHGIVRALKPVESVTYDVQAAKRATLPPPPKHGRQRAPSPSSRTTRP